MRRVSAIPAQRVPIRQVPRQESPLSPIPSDAKLVSMKTASEHLNEKLASGLSYNTFRKYCDRGILVEGIHYYRLVSNRIVFYLPNLEEAMRSSGS